MSDNKPRGRGRARGYETKKLQKAKSESLTRPPGAASGAGLRDVAGGRSVSRAHFMPSDSNIASGSVSFKSDGDVLEKMRTTGISESDSPPCESKIHQKLLLRRTDELMVSKAGGGGRDEQETESPSYEKETERKLGAGGDNNGRPIGRGGAGVRNKPPSWEEILTTRPELCETKVGISGSHIKLLTNYFLLETTPNWTIYQYRVDFNVEEEREGAKKKWLRDHAQRLGRAYIFDGTMLFSSRLLTPDKHPLMLTSIRESDNFPVQIEIRLVQELKRGNYVFLQIFNILVRRSLHHLKLQLVSRNYFDASSGIKIPEYNLELWPGYFTAIRQHERHILMCAEITHKVMRTDTALGLLAGCIKQSKDYRQVYQQAVIGQIVLTDYNNKTYRIDDVDFSVNPTSTFKLKNEEEISYIDYYQKRYQIRIRDHKQPLLVSRSSARALRSGAPAYCLLVPELCRMTGLSDAMRENNQLMRELSNYTRVNPEERIQKLMRFNQRLLSKREIVDEFRNWDIGLSKELLSIPGRELAPEMIVAGQRQKFSAGLGGDWTKAIRLKPMLKCGNMRDWAVVCPKLFMSDLMPFLETLKKAALGMDFRLPPPKIFETASDKPAHIVEAVEDALARSMPDMIMFVCGNNRADRYNAIKKKCYIDRGIPSQVVLIKSMRNRGVMSIATKIAIQLNCKIGGAPWTVDIPMQKVMVVGYDACHDSGNKGKSYGAMVASLNKAMNVWFSTVSHHSNGEELSDTLSLDICKALRKFMEFNEGELPNRIIVYRDGVGEGQIRYVYEHEVNLLKKRLTEMYGNDSWRLGYIIVTKRINTRLFKGGNNPIPGTVVDDVITLPERYDFYLISQAVNSGTVTPTSYNVISDNLGLLPDQIQRLTYKMTHLYYNWSGTVRVPAPCQYAHKLAFLVGQSLRAQPHIRLDTSLYFL